MTAIKVAPALPKNALPDMLPIDLWNSLGQRRMALVEFVVAERTEAADEDSELSAKIAITSIEFAHGNADEHVLRNALAARYQARTAKGTLTEGQQFDLGADTLTLAVAATIEASDVVDEITVTRNGKTAKVTRGSRGQAQVDGVDLLKGGSGVITSGVKP